jgi:serine/threonine protein kinase/tetratricopeptide (TPR) repeat protein
MATVAANQADAGRRQESAIDRTPNARKEVRSNLSSECPPRAGLDSSELSVPSVKFLRILNEFTAAWERGAAFPVEEFLGRLDPSDNHGAVELIYREFCLAEAAGHQPHRSRYVDRFPEHGAALERVLGLHGACAPSLLSHWVESAHETGGFPSAGDSIGPYVLRREMGRGSFARVYLAEQSNLENRLVVLKIASRHTREPWILARVRHAHIVEIISHTPVDHGAFQLICMPFWGGATLAAVLAAQRQRKCRPTSGRALLSDLASVAAREHPAIDTAGPAREILASLTYDQALAWVGARLAEALDHAFRCGVAHRDVKPSNVLLSAHGNPMLLDFNLANECSRPYSVECRTDRGGTLAYMAPERLRVLLAGVPARPGTPIEPATCECGGATLERPATRDEIDAGRSDDGPHRGDIYALGMVLLEALTGERPEQLARSCDPALQERAIWFRTAATTYTAARTRSARAIIRKAESARGWDIPPGLRMILERCLDPQPCRRFRRARELAEDLDRWRSDQPLTFTAEPFWTHTLPCWIRRRMRRLIYMTAALPLVVGFSMAAVMLVRTRVGLDEAARFKLDRHWGDTAAYRFQRSNSDWLGDSRQSSVSFAPREPDDSHAIETALRAIKDYDVFGSADWRTRDDVRALPSSDRDDLELWLMEQVYRYCWELCERPNSWEDWQRAWDDLGKLRAPRRLLAFSALVERLRLKLGLDDASALRVLGGPDGESTADVGRADSLGSSWLNEYLLGIAAERELELQSDGVEPRAETPAAQTSTNSDLLRETVVEARRRSAERSLGHYLKLLETRPESYWGHYRAAASCFVLGAFAETAVHLEHCLRLRPTNPVLRGQRAACLAWLERYDEALVDCDYAIRDAPDLPELYRTRVFIRAAAGYNRGEVREGIERDIDHLELLSRTLPLVARLTSATHEQTATGGLAWPDERAHARFPSALHLGARFACPARKLEQATRVSAVSSEEIDARGALAWAIRSAGDSELADAELAKILILDPDNIPARMTHALNALEKHRDEEALSDLDAVLTHLGLTQYIRKDPSFLTRFHQVSRRLLREGNMEEAKIVARHALDLAIAVGCPSGESHYHVAQVYAVLARTDPEFIAATAKELWWVFRAHPLYRNKYLQNQAFDPVRAQVDAELSLNEMSTQVEPSRAACAERN